MRLRLATAALVFSLGGCQRSQATGPVAPPTDAGAAVAVDDDAPWPILSTELLAVVPADTPFVLSQDEPLPPVAVERLAPVLEPMRTLLELGFAQAHERSDAKVKQAAEALFGGPPTLAALADIGLDLNPRFVVYGLGLAPVLRLRLKDADAFLRALRRADARVGGERTPKEFHGQAYLSSQSDDSGVSLVAIVGPDLVVAHLPAGDMTEELLPLVFGQELPEVSMASSGRLAEVRARHGLTRSVSGYFDVHALMSAFLGHGSELTRRVAVGFGVAPKAADPVCAEDFLRLLAVTPRVVVGFRELSRTSIVWSQTVETSPEIARMLATLPGTLPQTAPARGPALATLGVGMNLEAWAAAVRASSAAVLREPFRCPDLTAINEAAASTEAALARIPPALFGVSGVSMSIHDFAPDEGRQIDAVIVLETSDPKALLSVLSKADAGTHLDRLKLRRPVRLRTVIDRDADDDEIVSNAWVARGRHSLGVAVGRASQRDLLAALDARRPNDGALMFATMDFAAWIERNRDPVERLLRLKGRMVKAFAEGVLALLSRVEVRVTATEQGLGLLVDLRDVAD